MGRQGKLLLVVRIVASVAMLAVLFTRFDLHDLAALLPRSELSSWSWIIAGLAVTLAAALLATLRWQRVLDAIGLPTDLQPLLSHNLAGQFVSNFLPTTVGGDVLRVTRLSQATAVRRSRSPRWCSSASPASWCCP